MTSWFTTAFSRRCLLPAFLLAATILFLGAYFETNDDIFIVFLLRGVGTLQPVDNLHLYFHGLSALLAALYQALPALPWYGLLLYSLLLVSFCLLFSVLDKATAAWSTRTRVLILVLFFVATGLSSVLRMNFTRIPILLSGATVLYSLQRLRARPAFGWWWVAGSFLMLLAWSVRPSGAFLGMAAVVPVVFWIAPWRSGLVTLALFGSLLVGASTWQMLRRTTNDSSYQQIDILKANHKDYNLYSMQPRTANDSMALESLDNWWGLSDTTLVNKGFFERTGTMSLAHSVHNVLVPKSISLFGRLAGDYFFVVFLNALLLWVLARQQQRAALVWAGLYLLYMAGLMIGLGIVLQLPARVATPLLGLFTAAMSAYVIPQLTVWPFRSRIAWLGTALLGVCLLGAVVLKNVLRARRHYVEQQKCEHYIAQIATYVGRRPLVMVSPDVRSLSPFRNYDLHAGPMLLLNGWTAHDASQLQVMHSLGGTTSFRQAMQVMANRRDVIWLFPDGFGSFFTRYLNTIQGSAPTFCPVGPLLTQSTADTPPQRFYQACSVVAPAGLGPAPTERQTGK
ncbi:hypothetical protein [Hymenobacter algoricola]|uniref:Glycosyltransferase RgtA/B/C/D-like domain-containing protein n=1 Tax=Hymenobacter algoricola TaxID=486267 RepID=A0ABP7NPI5_9BACT